MNVTQIIICSIFLILIKTIINSPKLKGFIGEWIVKRRLKKLPPEYHVLHNILLPNDENTSQIDHIVVSPYGIFSIETKNYQGWIYGKESQYQWTQVFGRNKFKFYNPIIQNKSHIKALNNIIKENVIHSMIVFTDGTFKTELPEYVMYSRAMVRYIKRFCDIVFDDIRIAEIINKINNANITEPKRRKEHIKYAKAMKAYR
jgi:hypothetical protein